MKLSVGETIRALRRRDGRTQEALAEALGVTGQAVSRWEAGGSYPDLELIPAHLPIFSAFPSTSCSAIRPSATKKSTPSSPESTRSASGRAATTAGWTNACPCCARRLRSSRRTSGCSLRWPTRCRRPAGGGITNGCITTKKAICSTAMTSTKATRTGRKRSKSASGCSKRRTTTRFTHAPSIYSCCCTAISGQPKRRSPAPRGARRCGTPRAAARLGGRRESGGGIRRRGAAGNGLVVLVTACLRPDLQPAALRDRYAD